MAANRQFPFVPLSIAVLTISDSRAFKTDTSGALLKERIESAGHRVVARAIVKDKVKAIREKVKAWIRDKRIDVVITTGGTGFTGKDVTPEAVEPLLEKKMDGFSAVFHQVSMKKIGTSTIQSARSRAARNPLSSFGLPGSPGACRDAWDEILVNQLDLRHKPCNFVEILPRLDEHLKRTKMKTAK